MITTQVEDCFQGYQQTKEVEEFLAKYSLRQ